MEIAIAVAETVLEYTVAPIGRQFGYLIFYRNNVNELKEQLQKLEAERESLQHVVEEARRNGKEIERSVQEWLDRVDEIRGETEKFYQEESQAHTGCSYNSCPNLWSRHQLSRRAKKMVEELVKVKGEGKFDRVSYTKPPQWAAAPSTSFYLGGEAFESRLSTLNSIMEALADNTINMVGVYGLPGVGKTTLAKEVAKKAEGEKLYDMVVMVEVKQNPENKTIQREIADMVGLKFDEESEVIRASRLCERLKQEKKLLVILDDLWGRLDLRKIGIPSTDEQKGRKVLSADEYKGCKILLTSRSEEVLSNQMNCKRNIKVGELSEEEAWELFKEKAELHDESDPELLIVATQVAQKCAGLPIAIVTVARALRNKSPFEWRDALWQLQQPALRNVSGVKEVVDSSIKLSYDHLESKELKSIFLLSAMLSNDTYASDLLKYCVGLGLFQGIYTMERARDRLDTLIQKLKALCLLLDSTASDCFQMHDVVRDVALSIASNEQDHFVVRYDKIYEWPDLQNCKSMCLNYCDIKELPQKLYCPRLEALLLYCNDTNMRIPENFFKEMSPLRVMDLTGFHFSSLPISIILLTNLTTLCLDHCVLEDIAMIGELRNLKVLSLMQSIIQRLPHELGHLTQLQLLDLSNCRKLEVIPQKVISSLNKLEALYLENSFKQWQDEGSNGKTANARVAELKDLTNLSTLYVHIPDVSILPKDLFLFLDKLERYKLLIGDVWEWSCNYETSKTLKLKLKTSVHLEYGLKRLLEKVQALYLDELIGIKDVYELNKRGFPYLKHLWIQNNSQIECIINSTHEVHVHDAFPKLETLVLANMIHLEKLCQGQLTMKSFSELRVIEVESCEQMKSLFSISLVRSFSQLVEIKISACKLMNHIVDLSNQEKMDNNTTIGKVQFHNLRSLTLNNLPALISFCFDDTRSYASTMSYEKLDTFEPLFNDKIVFPNLDSLKLSSINFQKIWQDSFSACSWIKSLTNLTVEGCGSLPHIISTALAMRLVSLKRLKISRCEKVEEILFKPEDVKGKEALNSTSALFSEEVIFPSLEIVIFSHMKNLQKIWPSHCAPDSFSKLKEVEINYCDKLMTVFPSYMVRSLCHVEMVTVTQCGSLETIYDLQGQNIRDAQGELETKLKTLIVLHLPNLRDIWNSDPNSVLSFSNLQTVQVVACGSLKNIFPTSVALNLVLLEELKIQSCGIEELVAKEQNAIAITKFELPCLTSVTLANLLKLKRFYPGVHILECPKLKKLDGLNCQKMELFGLETKNFATTGNQPGQSPIAVEQPFFSIEKVVPNLELLALSGMEARKIWKGQFREDFFQNISMLILQEFEGKVAEFPYWFLHKMPNLKEMDVQYSSFRELFPIRRLVAEEKQTADIVRLRQLYLRSLPRLESICKEGFQLDPVLEKLEELYVCKCFGLANLIPESTSFNWLTLLEVTECDGLKNLFSPSTAKGLLHLKDMRIKECKMLQEIVARVDNGNKKEISFSYLESLELTCLPNLLSFCTGNNNFDFPYLEEVCVKQCPRMKMFSEGELRTTRLQIVHQEKKYKSYWEGDLNSTIKKLYKDKVAFCGMEKIKLNEFPELIDIWNGKLPDWSFSNLKSLIVDKCDFLSYVIPSHLLCSFSNLQELQVSNCNSIEVAFDLQEVNVKNRETLNAVGAPFNEEAIFPSLEIVIFSHMDNLQKIWSNHCASDSFSKLKKVEINYCDKLVTVFPSYIVRSLCHVETVTVTQCVSLETIYDLQGQNIRDAQGELETKLKNLIVLHLPNLRDIWNSDPNSVLSFSNLQTVQVVACGSLKNIFPTFVALNLVLLERLTIQSCGMEEIVAKEENANAITKFELPRLTSVTLGHLLKLKRFYPGVHILECPKLKWLDVFNCQKMELFELETKNFPATMNQLGQLDVAIEQSFFSIEKVVPNLEFLTLSGMEARKIWKGQFQEDLLHNIQKFSLQEFEDKVAEFPYWFLHKMPNLKGMTVSSSSFRELFPIRRLVAEEKQTADIVRLRELYLWSLPMLERVCIEGFQLDPVLEKLEELYVWKCSGLANLIPTSALFNFLTLLKVTECDGLKNLFSPLAAKGLVHLKDMRVRECKMLQEIVARVDNENENEIFFSHLESLELTCLPNLLNFCSGKNNFDFPYLEEVIVKQCPMMKIFSEGELRTTRLRIVHQEKKDESFWEGDLNSTIKKLYKDKVAFCGMEKIKFDEFPELIDIWSGKLPDWSFSNLTSLIIDKCDFLSYVIPSHLLCSFSNLQELQVSNCNSIEVAFDLQEVNVKNRETLNAIGAPFNEEVIFPSLETMIFSHMDNLQKIWSNQCSSDSFSKLKKVEVVECGSLKNVFPISVALNLVLLEELKIQNCAIEELVAMDENANAITKFELPRLASVTLVDLLKLKRFYPGVHILECPKLKWLDVVYCQKMELFGLETKSFAATGDQPGQLDVAIDQPFFSLEKVVPNLEFLTLSGMEARKIWKGQFREDLFYNIREFELQEFEDEVAEFPYWFLHKMPNLKGMYVLSSSFRELFPIRRLVAEEKQTADIVRLRELYLWSLPRLKNICKEGFQLDPVLEKLEELSVWKCSGLANLIPASASFNFLTLLKVNECDGLKNLFSPLAAKGLVHLKDMRVKECKMLQEIVARVDNENENEIFFSHLESLELTCLPNLLNFCSGKNNFDFPYLEEVIVKQCPRMKIFSEGELRTTRLRIVHQEKKDESFWEGDLNSTIKKLYKDKVAFCGMEKIKLNEFPELIDIWNGKLPDWSFTNLKSLIVDKCDFLSYVIPSHLLCSFSNLQELQVSNCNSIEVAFDLQEVNVKNRETLNAVGAPFNEEAIFPSLEIVIFSHMDNLQKIWSNHCASDSFSKLKKVEINYCDKLVTVFPSYMLRPLCHVETVTITSCGSLETIYDLQGQNIRDPQGELETKLKNLIILHLPNLRDIWNSDPHSILSFSNLLTVQVVACGSLKNIFPTSVALNLVLLERLTIQRCGMEEIVAKEENANAITKFELPRLTSVTLGHLLKLRRFYPGVHILECPKLKWLDVLNCQKMELFGLETKNFPAIGDQLGQLDVAVEQPFFSIEKVVPNLEFLTLSGMEARKIWKGQFREDLFQNISTLRLQEFEDKATEFPYWLRQKMPNLKGMYVLSSSFRELFPIRRLVAEEKQIADIVRLRELYLWSLPRLKNICKEGFQLDPVLEKLEELYVWKCSGLANLIPASASFSCLTLLKVTECDGLKNLFSPLAAKGLVHLKDMRVKECKMLQEIVARVDNENENEIFFSHLESLELTCLPNLLNFCSGKNNFDFPYLEEVIVKQCPRMKIFSKGELRTTRLRIVHQEKKDESFWEGDLNSTIKKLYKDKVAFCGMEKIKLDEFPELIDIWNGKLPDWSFSNLKSLIVDKCDFLSYVIPSHLLCSFSNLQELQVSNCNSIEVAFDLQEVNVKNRETLNAVGAPFNEEAIFPSLETVIFSHMDNLQKIWSNHCASDSFSKLKKVEINYCDKLVTVFPSYMLRPLCHVETVTITSCGSLETIYDLQGQNIRDPQGELETKLKNLIILHLPNLRDIWNSDPHSILSFSNLLTVQVVACGSMKNIFPTSLALNLVLLERLTIQRCGMEEIVAKEENANAITKFELPRLTTVTLGHLLKLKRFYPGVHILGCPKLKWLDVLNCPKMELFELENKNFPATGDQLGQLDVAIEQPFFSVEKVVPNLEFLTLSGMEARKIWKRKFREDLFHNIQKFSLQEFEDKVAEFPYWFLHKMPNLKGMTVGYSSFKELFPIRKHVAEEKQTADLVRLRELYLWNLPRLERVCIEEFQLDPVLEKLEELYVWKCSGLANLIPASASFNYLTSLQVTECDGLKNLFSPSTAKGLLHLKNMRIKECKMLQEIVARVDNENKIEISFSHIESLELSSLPNLSSFCSGNNNFDFPYLEEVCVKQCSRMKIFSEGELKTTRLRIVHQEKKDESYWEGDLNSTIKKIYEDKVGFCGIEKMKLDEYPDLIEIWNGKLPDWSFSNLKSLIMDKCDYLSYVIPSHLLCSLSNLEELQVSNCNSIEVVFDLQEIKQTHALVPLRLKKMSLEHLPKLMHVWNKDPQQIDFCQHLQELIAKDCQSLRSIFPASIAKHLKRLNFLKIVCCGVEVIVSKEEVTEADAIFVFPQLYVLTLWKLPNLRNFYPQRHKLECPKLRVLYVYQCQNVEAFGTVDAEEKDGVETRHPLFLLDKVNPNLEELALNQKAVTSIRNDQFQADLFHKVNILYLESFHDEPLTFPYSILERFPNLYELRVTRSSFEEIFPCQEPFFDHMGKISPIKELRLAYLDQLKNITNADSQFELILQNLEKLDVECCSSLISVAPSSTSFHNLTTLIVCGCHGMIYLLTSSTAKSLVQLRKLKIDDCKLTAEIVTDIGEVEGNRIAMKKLEYLELTGLTNLKTFCSHNHAFEFTSLIEVTVKGCPKMNMFCQGFLVTPILEGVLIEDDEVRWEDNLNKTIEQLFMEKDGQNSVEG